MAVLTEKVRSQRMMATGVDDHSCPYQTVLAACGASSDSFGIALVAAGSCGTNKREITFNTGEGGTLQARRIVLQHRLLKIRRNHAVPAHIELPHLASHHRLLPHELVVLLFAKTHHILSFALDNVRLALKDGLGERSTCV